MANDLTYSQALDLLPLYVLGALEPEEMLAMDSYIRQQRAFLVHLEETEEMVTLLTHAAPDVPLPPDGRERLMARVQADLSTAPARQRGEPAPRASRSRWWLPSLPRLAFARASVVLAFLALLLLAAYTFTLQRELEQVTAQVEESIARTMQLEQVNEALLEQLRGNQLQLARLARAERAVVLPGTEVAPSASGAFFFTEEEGVLLLQGLEPLPPDETYQLWLIPPEGDPVSAGLVALDAEGPTTTSIQMPPDVEIENVQAVGLSVEPAGGSAAPTGPIVLLGQNS